MLPGHQGCSIVIAFKNKGKRRRRARGSGSGGADLLKRSVTWWRTPHWPPSSPGAVPATTSLSRSRTSSLTRCSRDSSSTATSPASYASPTHIEEIASRTASSESAGRNGSQPETSGEDEGCTFLLLIKHSVECGRQVS